MGAIMSTFKCTLEEFKKIAADFHKKAQETEDLDALDAGFKCVGLHYLGIEPIPEPGSYQQITAVSVLDWASGVYFAREMELTK